MSRVVGVHGVGNHRPGETTAQSVLDLCEVWRSHLRRGGLATREDPVDLTVAYYADCLRSHGRQGDTEGLDDLSPEARELVADWLVELGVPAGTPQGYPTWPIRQALAWVAQRRRLSPRLVEMFVATFFREVATYLGTDSVRKACRERVIDSIQAHQPDVVIAHSLGSVVAYEALWNSGATVDLLITLGSPLALPHAVFPRLDPAPIGDKGSCPPGVRRWVNIADPGDLVALPPKGIADRFTGVAADHTTPIHVFDFHLVANYLACPPLTRELRALDR